METSIVDPRLNKILDSNLPDTDHRDNNVEGEEFNISDDDDVSTPITEHTKSMIASLLLSSVSGNPEATIKIVNILKSLENLSEKEGLLYIKAIQASDMTQVNNSAITLILKMAVDSFFSPDCPPDKKQTVLQDKYIRASLSNILSGLFYKLGYWSGAILFFLFALESYDFPLIRFSKDEPDRSSTEAPV
jgi:hypothetical protein